LRIISPRWSHSTTINQDYGTPVDKFVKRARIVCGSAHVNVPINGAQTDCFVVQVEDFYSLPSRNESGYGQLCQYRSPPADAIAMRVRNCEEAGRHRLLILSS
jgi:hypothetical protein